MGWFWADSTESYDSNFNTSNNFAKCPVPHETIAKCPVNVKKSRSEDSAKCPVDINPLNNMPNIGNRKMAGQKLDLPTQRTVSSIPRGEDGGFWEYPSPQQMFNAMLRKGKASGIEEEAVESMVDVHNFLNEGAWQEILEWEKPYTEASSLSPKLLKFTGRPDDMSPRARMYMVLSKLFPSTFSGNPPFDRHDWTVLRGRNQYGVEQWGEVRYVIDYYGGPDNDEGYPTFFLDVRPALDSWDNVLDRWDRWANPLINKALGKDIN